MLVFEKESRLPNVSLYVFRPAWRIENHADNDFFPDPLLNPIAWVTFLPNSFELENQVEHYGYMAFLLPQFAVLHANFQKQLALERLGVEGLLKLEHEREEVLAWRRFANDYLASVLAQQFFLLVFITPLLLRQRHP